MASGPRQASVPYFGRHIERADSRVTAPDRTLPETGDPGLGAVTSSTLLQGGGTAKLETIHMQYHQTEARAF